MRRPSFALVAVASVLALAAFARPVHAQYQMERRSAVAPDSAGATVLRAVRADLTRLRVAQDSFYVTHRRYAADTAALGGWQPTSEAVVRITRADSAGWVAEAEHRQLVGPEVLTVRRTSDQARRR